jgi:hypothetical protein
VGRETGAFEVLEGGVDVPGDAFGGQCRHVRPDGVEVGLVQHGVARAVEQVRRNGQPVSVGEALADVLDVVGHAERLLHHHHAADRDLGGMADR